MTGGAGLTFWWAMEACLALFVKIVLVTVRNGKTKSQVQNTQFKHAKLKCFTMLTVPYCEIDIFQLGIGVLTTWYRCVNMLIKCSAYC